MRFMVRKNGSCPDLFAGNHLLTVHAKTVCECMGVARGAKGVIHPKFLENIVILCYERRFSKQNSVVRLKSNILPPKKFVGWLSHCANATS